MDPIVVVIAVVVACPTVVVLMYPWLASIALRRDEPRRAPASNGTLAVIVPCKGAGEGTAAALASIAAQETSRPTEVLFCVEDRADSAVPVIEALVRERPQRCRMVLTGDAGRDLGKLHNLMAGVDATTAEYLAFVDSDVTFDHPGALQAVVADLDRPGVGLVSGFPAYRAARNLPAAFLAMTINHDLLGCFAVVARTGSLVVANGSCLAIPRAVLDATGGLLALRDQVLMDTTLARRVAGLGYRVHLHDRAVPVVRRRASWRECWEQTLRWQVSMRRALPLRTYLAFLWLRSASLGCLAALIASSFAPAAWLVATAFLAARAYSAWRMDARYLHSESFARFAWALPLVELGNGLTATIALFARGIAWGGRRYRVNQHGRITPVPGGAAGSSKRRGPQPAL